MEVLRFLLNKGVIEDEFVVFALDFEDLSFAQLFELFVQLFLVDVCVQLREQFHPSLVADVGEVWLVTEVRLRLVDVLDVAFVHRCGVMAPVVPGWREHSPCFVPLSVSGLYLLAVSLRSRVVLVVIVLISLTPLYGAIS